MCPCRRFAAALAGDSAWLGVRVARYAFPVRLSHSRHLSGFCQGTGFCTDLPGLYRVNHPTDDSENSSKTHPSNGCTDFLLETEKARQICQAFRWVIERAKGVE